MPDFTQYQPPGVYIEEDLSSLVNVVGVRPSVIGIVGPSVGYRTATEAIILTGTDAVELGKLGIDTATVRVSAADGTIYDLTTDYTVTAGAGEDTTPATADDTTTVTRVEGGDITSGAIVYVSYQYTDAEYYAPVRASDFDDVKDAFGEPIDIETGEIRSPLSFAAQVAFENGASEVVLISTTGSTTAVTRTELTAAYAKLSALYDVNIVVPLPIGISGNIVEPGDTVTVGTDLEADLETAATNRIFRVGILGFDPSATIDPGAVATTISHQRVIAVWPNRVNRFHSYIRQNIEVGGYYLAAAYAGRLASLPVQMPLTKKRIRGFSSIPGSVLQGMTLAQRNTWSNAGVAVTEQLRTGDLVVRHGVTTDRTNIYTREISLVRARDALVNLLQETVDTSGLVGSYIDEDTPARVKGVVAGVLETAKSGDTIVDYTDLKVRQLAGDPSVIEVKFSYMPAYPLNYIVIVFSVNTGTGETTFDLADAA